LDGCERELIERARTGDEGAYERLLESLVLEAQRFAYGMLQDRFAAEDCVQEAAWRAWMRMGNLLPDRSFRPWFLGIVANQCRETLRSRWWRTRAWLTDRLDGGVATDTDDWLTGADLRRAVAALPHEYRLAIVLRYYLDLSEVEIAATLGISAGGARTRIHRARGQLRATLNHHGGDVR
jgi:RNA polymerase sigma-70 factor (ECF subfamily)